jgi:hypothetical protein
VVVALAEKVLLQLMAMEVMVIHSLVPLMVEVVALEELHQLM